MYSELPYWIEDQPSMEKNGKDTKQTRHIAGIMNLVRNVEEWNLHKTVWCEVDLQLADIGTKNVK